MRKFVVSCIGLCLALFLVASANSQTEIEKKVIIRSKDINSWIRGIEIKEHGQVKGNWPDRIVWRKLSGSRFDHFFYKANLDKGGTITIMYPTSREVITADFDIMPLPLDYLREPFFEVYLTTRRIPMLVLFGNYEETPSIHFYPRALKLPPLYRWSEDVEIYGLLKRRKTLESHREKNKKEIQRWKREVRSGGMNIVDPLNP